MKLKSLLSFTLCLTLLAPLSYAKEKEEELSFDREKEKEETEDFTTSSTQSSQAIVQLSEEDLKSEEKAKVKVEKIFDKQFKKFRTRIKRLLREFSDSELRQLFEESNIRVNDAINGDLVTSKINDILNTKDISLSFELSKLTNEKFKAQLKEDLFLQAQKLGSFRALLIELKDMEVNKCLIKKISIASLIIVGTGVGVGVVVATTALSGGLITSLVGGVLVLDAVAISPIDKITKSKSCDLVKK